MPAAYPIMLDVTERLCVIIGGGTVAVRKARGLFDAGARRVRMVSPTFRDDLPAATEKIAERYEARHLQGAGLVFAATDSPETNAAVVRDARLLNVLVNRADADDEVPGDFTTPAAHRDGPVCITVTTTGAPALAAMIRDVLASRFDPRWRNMAEAMQRLRPVLRVAAISPERRREAFRDLATNEAMATLEAGGIENLRRWLTEKYSEMK